MTPLIPKIGTNKVHVVIFERNCGAASMGKGKTKFGFLN